MASRSHVGGYRRFVGIYRLYLQGSVIGYDYTLWCSRWLQRLRVNTLPQSRFNSEDRPNVFLRNVSVHPSDSRFSRWFIFSSLCVVRTRAVFRLFGGSMCFKIVGDTTYIYIVQGPKRRITINTGKNYLLHFVVFFLPDVPLNVHYFWVWNC
jgi:hypothetical protein